MRPPELLRILDEAGQPPAEVTGDHLCRTARALESCEAIFQKFDEIFEKMRDSPERSFEEFLESCRCDPETARWATAYIEGFNAAPRDRVSVQWLALEHAAAEAIDGDKLFRIPAGYDTVPRWLATGLEESVLCLNTAVTGIEWRRGNVRVSTKSHGAFTATCALITAPLGVLQAGAIRFTPEPSAQMDAIHRLATGCALRITMRFRKRFWDPRLSFIHSLNDWMPTWWTSGPRGAPLLTGWTAGPLLERAAGIPQEAMVDRSLESLGSLLGMRSAELRGLLEDWRMHDWQADPFARGAYSYVPVGNLDARRVLATPVEGTLFFAGEATNFEGHSGTVHGAIATGRRAAQQILGSSSR
jgi:monoamine oxidase